MSKVVSFADAQIAQGLSALEDIGETFIVGLTPQIITALKFIARYENVPNIVSQSVRVSSYVLKTFYSSETIYEMMDEKEYYWNLEPDMVSNPKNIRYTINDEKFFDDLANDFDLPPRNAVLLFYDFYLQSFVDSYNCRENHSRLKFTPQKTKRRQWMSGGDQDLLGVLTECPYLVGFTPDAMIAAHSSEELEDILAQRKNIYTYAPDNK